MSDLPIAEVYIDESSHTNHRYLVIGGLIAEASDARNAHAVIANARLPELPKGTMKWTKVSRAKLNAYKRIVDCTYDMQHWMMLDFHSIVIDSALVRHKKFNRGSREIGFNKEIYQLAMKFGRLYDVLFHIYPDKRTTNQDLNDLRLMLNRGIKKQLGEARDWPYRRIQFREPDDSNLLQMADVFSGAIAWALNGHANQHNASPAKTELSGYILDKWRIHDVMRDTAIAGNFTIWHRQLRK